MTAEIYLSLRTNPSESKRVLLHNINLESKVSMLKQSASQETELLPEDLSLIFCGNILDDESSLINMGVQSGVTIHVMKKVVKVPQKSAFSTMETEIALAAAFKSTVRNPNYRAALQRLSGPYVLDNIMAATPGLREDPVALAMLQDPELLTQLCDPATVKRILETHPALIDAVHYIVVLVHDEASSSGTSQAPASAYSYTLEALSDDDDMESSQSSDSQPQAGESSYLAATRQLSALSGGNNWGRTDQTANGASSATPGIITHEMFSQALGEAFAASSVGQPSSQEQPVQPAETGSSATASGTTAPQSLLTAMETTTRRLTDHLIQMHELGLRDDTLNLQALQAADWNVQEAINLLFSGVMNDTDGDNLE